jgi:hypothetical protein
MKIRPILFIIAAALFPIVPFGHAGAQQADVIRGRVTGPDSAALEGVTVTVTSISGNVSRTAKTDKSGRFTVTFPSGDGDYMVAFAALGYAAKRFEVKRAADEEILLADARLAKVGAILDAVEVRADRQRVNRNEPPPPDISGTETPLSNSAVPANLMGDLAAMAASLPGVQSTTGADGSDGYSVLGLGSDQNNTTLNGMQFGGSNLPRDASVSSSLITSPYDVSRGGFSGAQMSLRTRSGSNFQTRGMSLNVDAPQMQWSDRAAQSLGQEYTNVSLGGTVSGPLRYDKAFYNVAYQLGRRSNDLQTLLNTRPSGFQAIGLASDSVARLLSILGTARVPMTVSGAPDNRLSDNGALFGSLDFAPPSSSSGQALNISFNGNWSRQNPTSGIATELPAHSGDRTSWRGGVQARQNMYFGVGILSETSLGYSASRTESNPFLRMPTGVVRVNSTFDDGTSGVQNLLFGGSQSSNSAQTSNSVAFLNTLSWFSTNNKHRLKLTTEARRDGSVTEQASNLLGTFSFNSLADLQANRPATYSRMLGSRRRDVDQMVGAVSLGDSWRKSTDLQVQYGLRIDANKFLNDPELNPAVQAAFGVRNDDVPNRVYVSPRIGFSWTYGKAAQIAGFEGAFRGPRAVVRGGIGVFQNSPGTGSIGTAIDNTGLPGAVQQISCVGDAAPIPDWSSFADENTIPARCADGSTGTVFASSAPNVTLFSKGYQAPRSIRSNLQWNGPILGNRFTATVDGTVSLNHNQSSFTDLNFTGTPQFALPFEDNRPVYVQPASIVPATGAVSPVDARVNQEFSRVTQLLSDLKSQSAQLSLRLSPNNFNGNFNWSLSYVYSNVREQFRGFANTASNPLNVSWGRASFDSRHQIVYNLGYNFFDWVRVSWFGQFRSGSPYTPMVAGDINGDGYANDRAFIPADTRNPGLNGVSILDNVSSEARKCLEKQMGQLAARNSCQGPWFSNASMSISFNPVKVRMPQRATLSFQLSNPLGAADLMLHGSSKLHGWGQPSIPDQQLLFVRGFNPATKTYNYEVNQRFGSTNQSFGSFRIPVTLTAMMRFDVGPTRERQMLTQQLDRGRRHQGTKAPEIMLRAMYSSGGLPNPLGTILRQADTLKLTGAQADSLASLNRAYTIRNAALWTPLVKYYAELPDTYDRDVAYDKYMEARKATIDLLIDLAPRIKGVLTAGQRRKLPAFVASYLEPRYLASIRSGTAGFTGSSMFGVPVMMGGDVFVNAGGGGTHTVIIRK